MDIPINESSIKQETNRDDNFWLGFLIGYLTNLIGFILAIFIKKKKTRKGIIIGSTVTFVVSTIFAALLVYWILKGIGAANRAPAYNLTYC